jgi:hypothetical protein
MKDASRSLCSFAKVIGLKLSRAIFWFMISHPLKFFHGGKSKGGFWKVARKIFEQFKPIGEASGK